MRIVWEIIKEFWPILLMSYLGASIVLGLAASAVNAVCVRWRIARLRKKTMVLLVRLREQRKQERMRRELEATLAQVKAFRETKAQLLQEGSVEQ